MNHQKIYRMVGLALLAALTVVLQLLAGVIRVGTFPITLTLVPIIIGAALFGPSAGAFLGAVFGAVVFAGCVSGTDPGSHLLFLASPFFCALVCFGKGMLAGWCAGLVYRLIAKRSASVVRSYFAVLVSAIVAPVVNTGLFSLSLLFLFRETLETFAAGSDVLNYLFYVLIGVNFLLELGVNLVLSPVIPTMLRAIQKSRA